MALKKHLWRLHSWLGLSAGLGLVIMGFTGCVLVFSHELEHLLDARLKPASGPRLGLDELLRHAQAGLPDHVIAGLSPAQHPGHADRLWVIPKGGDEWQSVWLSASEGRLLTSPTAAEETLMGWLLALHYRFLMDELGMLIAGVFAVILCLLGISGVWLYRGFWRSFFTLRWGRSARLFFSDLHKMVGISSVGFHLILGFTGAWWNLSHLIRTWSQPQAAETGVMPDTRPLSPSVTLDSLLEKVNQSLPGYELAFLSLPTRAEEMIIFSGRQTGSSSLRSPYGSSAHFDPALGTLVELLDIRQAPIGQQIVDAFLPLHYGTFGGFPIKLLWSLLALCPGILAISGFWIWKSRQFRRKKLEIEEGTVSAPHF